MGYPTLKIDISTFNPYQFSINSLTFGRQMSYMYERWTTGTIPLKIMSQKLIC